MVTERKRMGLTSEDVAVSRRLHGANILTRQKRTSFLRKFIGSFDDPIIKILLVALFANAVVWIHNFNPYETLGIVAAILLATLISTISEHGSESAFLSLLKDDDDIFCEVMREGAVRRIPITELVCGDIVLLRAGEKIYADGFIVSGSVGVNQSALNGESREVKKTPGRVARKPQFDDTSSVFRGAVILSGEAVMEVTAVGDGTFYGTIVREVQKKNPDSPLKEKLAALAKSISRLGYLAAVLIALSDIFNGLFIDNGFDIAKILATLSSPSALFQLLLHAVTLALTVVVVAVPEGLPMMIGVVLSRNISRMKRDNVLVKRPVGIETAGGVEILFSDKTGTITYGELRVTSIFCGDGSVIGSPGKLRGELLQLYGLSCRYNTACGVDETGAVYGGNATDIAFFKSIREDFSRLPTAAVTAKVPFSSEKKYSAVTLSPGNLTLYKGAPEVLLPRCTAAVDAAGRRVPLDRAKLSRIISDRAKKAARMLAICRQERSGGLTLLFLCELSDKIRREAREAILLMKNAGVSPVMITGDNADTAAEIARQAGIFDSVQDMVLTSAELAKMSDDEVAAALPHLAVIARALPSDKSRLVRICHNMGTVCAMTGDGINDAPALKQADVGFAMGGGTEAAKEAGDIVILDDNISSIAKAVLYGRTIFKSIRKFLVFQLTMNFCAVIISLIAPLIGCETPVTVIQMLWINIIMDTLAALAFAGEAPKPEYMYERPIRRTEPVLSRKMKGQIFYAGVFSVLLMLWFLKSDFVSDYFARSSNPLQFYCAFFSLFVFLGVFNAFNARTHRLKLFAHLSENVSFIFIILFVIGIQLALIYFGGSVFRCAPLSLMQLLFTVLLSALIVPADLLRKLFARK